MARDSRAREVPPSTPAVGGDGSSDQGPVMHRRQALSRGTSGQPASRPGAAIQRSASKRKVLARRHLLTSESVTEGHPDKIADQISDAVLDAIYEKDPNGRVACETLVTTGLVVVAGEITTSCYIEIPQIVRERIHAIGYDQPEHGFAARTCGVVTSIQSQSPDLMHPV